MKKKASSVLALGFAASVFLTTALTPASASAATDKINVELNGANLQMDQEPFVHDARTFVPLRAIFEALGASIDWNPTTRTVTSTKGDVTIKLTLGSKTAYRNDAPVELDAAPMVRDERSYVPVRFIAESFNTPVKWDGATKTVRLLPSNRAELERIMSAEVPFPSYMHVDGYFDMTYTENGTVYTGASTSKVDFAVSDTGSISYHSIVSNTGTLAKDPNYEMYIKDERAFVLFEGFQVWQTSTMDKSPKIEEAMSRTKTPYVSFPTKYAKYAVLEQTDRENIVTFYMSGETYNQMAKEESYVMMPTARSFQFKYNLDKNTLLVNKYHMNILFDVQGTLFTMNQSDVYSKYNTPYFLRLPAATENATETILKDLN